MSTPIRPKKLQEVLNSPDKWTKKQYAKTANHRAVPPNDPDACSFCLTGAIALVDGQLEHGPLFEKVVNCFCRAKLQNNISSNWTGLIEWNDHPDTTFAMVQKFITDYDL